MKYLALFFFSILFFVGGWFSNSYFTDPEVRIVEHEKIVYETIEKDVYKMPDSDVRAELNRYYTETPRLNIIQLDSRTIRADAGLGDRDWSRKADIEVGRSGGFRFLVPVAIGVTAGTGAYFLLK